MPYPYKQKYVSTARELRKNATPQENKLWYDFLSGYPVRFQRQKVIENFIADFYCAKAKLVIELDGHHHYTQDGMQYDRERDDVLRRYGLLILRFPNSAVDSDFQNTCVKIHDTIEARTSQR